MATGKTKVELDTTLGRVILELDDVEAPGTTANFLAYVDAGHYDGTIFHRVIAGFMAQGGGYDPSFTKRQTRPAITNEATRERRNVRGTVAMARTGDPHSATAQFFISLADNGFLDHTAKTDSGWGYAVFGQVVGGMDVVDAIGKARTGSRGPFPKDAPLEDIVIRSARRVAP